MWSYLLAAFGGPAAPFVYVLLAVAAFALAAGIERVWVLARSPVGEGALAAWEARLRGAVRPAWPEGLAGRVLAAGWAEREAGGDAEGVWEAMQLEALAVASALRVRLHALATVASLATLIGLTGSVYGLIQAFSGASAAGVAERASRLSEGTSTAMATTALGLLLAIPSLLAHTALEGQVQARLAALEQVAGRAFLALRRAG